jgi:hypothetical protein
VTAEPNAGCHALVLNTPIKRASLVVNLSHSRLIEEMKTVANTGVSAHFLASDGGAGRLAGGHQICALRQLRGSKILADQNQRPPEICNANDRVTLLTKEALIWHLNVLLVIIWLVRGASDLALDCLSTVLSSVYLGCSGGLFIMLRRSGRCSRRRLICA